MWLSLEKGPVRRWKERQCALQVPCWLNAFENHSSGENSHLEKVLSFWVLECDRLGFILIIFLFVCVCSFHAKLSLTNSGSFSTVSYRPPSLPFPSMSWILVRDPVTESTHVKITNSYQGSEDYLKSLSPSPVLYFLLTFRFGTLLGGLDFCYLRRNIRKSSF